MPRIAIAVNDFETAVTKFREGFGLPVVDFSDRTVPDLGAHVGMCVPEGGSNIELMAPATPDKPLSQSLQKFLDRRGEGLYALMLEAPDPDAEAADLARRGLDVLPLMAGAGGRDIHPRSTHGVLIRVYPDNSVGDLGPQEHVEPGLSGIAKVIVATTDAAVAANVYREGLGLDVSTVVDDVERGVLQAVCRPPKGGSIELVSVVDGQKPFAHEIERFVAERGEGMFALVLEAKDPEDASSMLGARGVEVRRDDDDVHTSVFGARFLIA